MAVLKEWKAALLTLDAGISACLCLMHMVLKEHVQRDILVMIAILDIHGIQQVQSARNHVYLDAGMIQIVLLQDIDGLALLIRIREYSAVQVD